MPIGIASKALDVSAEIHGPVEPCADIPTMHDRRVNIGNGQNLTVNQAVLSLLLALAVSACQARVAAPGPSVEPAQARYAVLTASCAHGNANDCFEAGNMVFKLRLSDLRPCDAASEFRTRPGEDAEAAKKRLDEESVELFGQACDADIPEGCSNAGAVLAILGIDLGDEEYAPVADRAEAYFERACKLSSKSGCMFRGSTTRAK
jgi:TPR repeat protein